MAAKVKKDKSDHDLESYSNLPQNKQDIVENSAFNNIKVGINLSIGSSYFSTLDLSQIIRCIDDMNEFVAYLQKHNFSIFLPNKNFRTVFHMLHGS